MQFRQALIPIAAIAGFASSQPADAQSAGLPKGELSTARNHTGQVWLNELSPGDKVFDPSIATATFAPGAKLDWHTHPGGQVLVVTDGTGFYQERGKPGRTVRTGDVIRAAPGIEHWHGATPKTAFAYFAVTPTQKGKTIWGKPVTPAEYAVKE